MSPLSSEEKSFLLRLARRAVEERLSGATASVPDPSSQTPAMERPAGVFVTLHKQGELRGCVGMVEPRLPLYRAVREAAVAAAFADPRFAPLGATELADVDFEISVLSPSRPVTLEQIQVGAHGLIVTQGRARGLLLPQVAVERDWDARRFLEETCRKAGLAADAWRAGARVEAFQAEVFGERSLASKKPSG